MVGPVFYQEMLLGARRGRWHYIRWVYAGWLVVQLSFWMWGYMLQMQIMHRRPPNFTDLSAFARDQYVPFFTFQHFLLLILITPILTAGAVTDEKARGTLQYLLTADVYAGEVLIGKLMARTYQAFLLVLIGMPLLCFLGSYSDLDILKAAGFLFCSLLLLFSVGAVSMLASVWCRHTRDAVLGIYCLYALVFVIWYFGQPYLVGFLAPAWLDQAIQTLNPLRPVDVYWLSLDDEDYLRRLVMFTLVWGGLGLGCLMVASWRLRIAYVRQLEKAGKKKRLQWIHLRRPAVKNAPLVWKERYIEGIAPLSILRRIPTWVGVIAVFVITTVACLWILIDRLPTGTTPTGVWHLIQNGDLAGLLLLRQNLYPSDQHFYYQGWVVILIVVLIIGVRCSGAVTGEREKKSWEALLLTPLTTRQLIRGKMWGIAGASVPYLIAYAIPALFFSLCGGWGSFFWTVLWLGVILLGVFYGGSTGIWCSVRCPSSWRSLLWTLGCVYGGGFVLFIALSILSSFLAIFIVLFMGLIEFAAYRLFGTQLGLVRTAFAYFNAWCVALNLLLAGSFVLISWLLLRNAEYRVGIEERTKHWKDETRDRYRYRRRRRRRAYTRASVERDDWD